jgi:hypothetical protein
MRSKVRAGCFWVPVFFLLAALKLGAQEEGALIYYAQGNDFALTVNGTRSIIAVGDTDFARMELHRSDVVQTGAGVFLEIQLLPSGTVIKLAENTSLVYNGFDANGRFTDIGLLYGRVRLVTGIGQGEKTVVIRAGNNAVRIQEGDIGADYAVDPASLGSHLAVLPLLTIFNFKGSAEVHPFIPGIDTLKPLPVGEIESLSVEISPPLIYAGRKPLEGDIIGFWNRGNFAGFPPVPMPDTTLPELSPAPVVQQAPPPEVVMVTAEEPEKAAEPRQEDLDLAAWQAEMKWYKKAYRQKSALLITGFALAVIGAGAQIYAYTQFDTPRDSLARTIHFSAYAPLGLGLLSLLAGTAYDPLVPLD